MSGLSAPMRYQLVDEPKSGLFGGRAAPPFLAFLIGMFFPPFGFLAFAVNAFALNGPGRWREVGLSLLAVAVAWSQLYIVVVVMAVTGLPVETLPYLMILVRAAVLWIGFKIYLSQAHTWQLRQYLGSLRRHA